MKLDWHVRATLDVATELGLGYCAASCLALGNIAVDLLYHADPARHGMTRADPDTGAATGDPERSRQVWQEWIDGGVRRSREVLSTDGCCDALYVLGQALHSLQDVDAHKGMTELEHAHRLVCGDNPDNDAAAKERATIATRDFLRSYLDSLSPDELRGIRDCERDPWSRTDLLEGVDGPGYALSLVRLWWLGSKSCRDSREPPRVRWGS
jgi:hypothetical protein